MQQSLMYGTIRICLDPVNNTAIVATANFKATTHSNQLSCSIIISQMHEETHPKMQRLVIVYKSVYSFLKEWKYKFFKTEKKCSIDSVLFNLSENILTAKVRLPYI